MSPKSEKAAVKCLKAGLEYSPLTPSPYPNGPTFTRCYNDVARDCVHHISLFCFFFRICISPVYIFIGFLFFDRYIEYIE